MQPPTQPRNAANRYFLNAALMKAPTSVFVLARRVYVIIADGILACLCTVNLSKVGNEYVDQ